MNYFLYLISFILLISALSFYFFNKKTNRIFYVLAYLMPFWLWGIFFLLLSIIFWFSRINTSYPIISIFVFLIFLTKGLFIIFTPKRKIKIKIENWQKLSTKKKKLINILLIVMALLVFLITI